MMRDARFYGHSDLMRAGLANMLAPWVRCFLWCRDHDAEMLAPTWFKFRIGPYRRREADKRRYEKLFTNEGYVKGLRRALLLAWGRRVEEGEPVPARGFRPMVVTFSGLADFLAPALGRSQEVGAELRRITKTELLPAEAPSTFVAAHVRLGDFLPVQEHMLRAGEFNMRLPLEWYVAVIERLRFDLGPFPVRLFSDGAPSELAPILAVAETELVRGGTAITDMLDLSAAACIVASGSTFSTWAAYLGQVPSVWYPGQFRGSVMDRGDRDVEAVWEPGAEMPAALLDEVRARLDLARDS